MAVNLSPVGGVAAQFFDNSGNVLTGGKLYSYLAGTTTPAITYTTSAGNIAWSNPIILDAAGRVSGSGEVWLSDATRYKFILRDSNDVLIATYDNITGINSNFVSFTSENETQTATQGQTVFTLTTMQYLPATNNLLVFVNGSKQIASANYAETSNTVVTFVSGLNAGDVVEFSTAVPIAVNAVDAENVSYTPPFTGSVATNVEAKLAQTVSIKDFGAVGDGVADDTAAIQAALNSLVVTPTNLYFPAGTYKLSDQLNISSANTVGLYGAGRGLTTLKWTAGATSGGGIAIVYTQVLFPPAVQGMSLVTEGLAVGTALSITGPNAPSVTVLGPNINDIEVRGYDINTDCWDTGIHFVLCWYICLSLVTIKGLEETINPFTQSAGIKLNDCQVIYASKFTIIHVEDAILEQNTAQPRGEGFVFSDFELVGVANGFQMTAGAVAPGTNIGPGHINSYVLGINIANQYQMSIHDMLFYKTFNSTSNYVAIQMADCNSNHIHDNEIHGSATATGDTYGITITGTTTSDYNNVHDNTFRDFYGTNKVGIVVSTGAGFNNIHNNNCDATLTTNVLIDNAADKTNYLNHNLPTNIQSLTPDVATPSVGNDLCGQWNSTPTVATTITNFTDGYVSQVITVFATNTNTTLQNNANIALANGADYAMGAGQLITLRKDATIWREMSRSV
jgi:hypothetical protein